MKRLSILFLAIVAATAVWAGKPKIDPALLDSLRNANTLLMHKVEMLSMQVELNKSQSETFKIQIDDLKEQLAQIKEQVATINESGSGGAPRSGVCGQNLKWKFTPSTHTLEITGTGAMADYSGNQPWHDYMTSIMTLKLPEGLTKIGNYAFDGCSGPVSIEIPSSVKEIGRSAFEGCTGLTSLTISKSVKEIGKRAFYDCTNLRIKVPRGTKYNDGYFNEYDDPFSHSFYHCASVTFY